MASETTSPAKTSPASLKTNAAANLLSYATAVVVALVISPYLIRHLGDARYGVLSIAGELTGYYGLLDFGIRSALGYMVARAQGRGEWQRDRAVARSAFWLLCALAAAVLSIGLCVAAVFPRLFKIGTADPHEVIAALAITAVVFALNFPFSIPGAILNGMRRLDLISYSEIIAKLAGTAAMYAALRFGGGLVHVTAAQAGTTVLSWILLYFHARRLGLRIPIGRPRVDRRHAKELLTVGSATILIDIAGIAINQFQLILIGYTLGTAWVTYFTLGRYLPNQFYWFIAAFPATLRTTFTQYDAAGLKAETNRVFLYAGRLAGSMTCFTAAGILVFGRAFLALWVGAKYLSGPLLFRSDTVLFLLLLATLPRTFLSVPTQLLLGRRQLRFMTILRTAEAVMNVGLSLALVGRFGLAGVAIGTLLPSAVAHLCFMLPFTIRLLGIPARTYLGSVVVPSAGMGAITLSCGLLVSYYRTPDSWVVLGAEIAVVSVASCAAGWRLAFTREERLRIKERIAGARRD